jgi:hypothetical protein
MPGSFTIDVPNRVVTSLFKGRVVAHDIRQLQESILSHPDFDPSFRHLVDFREVKSLDLSGKEIRDTAETAPWVPEAGRVILAPMDLAFGLGRMFQMIRDVYGDQVQVFRNSDEAMAWLGLQ